MDQRERFLARRIALVALVVLLSACSKRCVYRPGGSSAEELAADAISASPECEEVRSRHDACGGSMFDAKLFCGPDEGDCIASARARIKCRLADPEGYTCSQGAGSHMFVGMTPPACMSFASLCTGKDKETTVIGGDGGH